MMIGISLVGALFLLRLSGLIWIELNRSFTGNDPLGVTALLMMLVGLMAAISVPLISVLTLRQIRVSHNGFLPQFRSLAARKFSKSGEILWNQVIRIDGLRVGDNITYKVYHVSGKTFLIPEVAFREKDRENVRSLISDVGNRLSKEPTWSKPKRRRWLSR